MASTRVLLYRRATDGVTPIVNVFPDDASACAFVNDNLPAWSERWAGGEAADRLDLTFVAESSGHLLTAVWSDGRATIERLDDHDGTDGTDDGRFHAMPVEPPAVPVEDNGVQALVAEAERAVRAQRTLLTMGSFAAAHVAASTAPMEDLFRSLDANVAWLRTLKGADHGAPVMTAASVGTGEYRTFGVCQIVCQWLGCHCDG